MSGGKWLYATGRIAPARDPWTTIASVNGKTEQEMDERGRLLAAAPELAEALESAILELEGATFDAAWPEHLEACKRGRGPLFEKIARLRHALAKARGEVGT